jgi:hypothetical protein
MNTTHHRTGIAVALVLALGWACLSQGPSETEAAQAVADEAAYAAALADGGRAQCAALGRTPIWTEDGNLVCRLPKRPTLLAQGGSL